MRALLLVLALLACSCLLLAGQVAAAPIAPLVPVASLSSTPAPGPAPGAYDPYLGQGDLLTKAVPVCCCSFGFCEEVPPGTICFNNNPICRCSGNVCRHI